MPQKETRSGLLNHIFQTKQRQLLPILITVWPQIDHVDGISAHGHQNDGGHCQGLATQGQQKADVKNPLVHQYIYIYISGPEATPTPTTATTTSSTSSARTSRGRKFPKGKQLYSKERICLLSNACKATEQRDAQIISLLLLPFCCSMVVR